MMFLDRDNNMQGFANVPIYAVASNSGFGNRVVRQEQKTRGLQILLHCELMIMSLLALRPVARRRDLVGTKLQQPFRHLQRMGAKKA
jgi:hypothetical protein